MTGRRNLEYLNYCLESGDNRPRLSLSGVASFSSWLEDWCLCPVCGVLFDEFCAVRCEGLAYAGMRALDLMLCWILSAAHRSDIPNMVPSLLMSRSMRETLEAPGDISWWVICPSSLFFPRKRVRFTVIC